MDKKFIFGAGTALGLTLGASGFVFVENEQPIAAQEAVLLEEITGDSKNEITAKITESGASSDIVCKQGVISNHPDKTYCTDGKTAGFLLTEESAALLKEEVEDKAPELVAEAVTIKNEEGKLYIEAKGIVEVK